MNRVALTVCGMSFVFFMTALGAATVFLFRKSISAKANAVILGFASGIMVAASVWSMLIPAIGQGSGKMAVIAPCVGLVLGCVFLHMLGALVPGMNDKKNTPMIVAIVVHNVPEGLAVGFALGSARVMGGSAALWSALALSFGIGLQNLPEGAAVSLPLLREGASRKKAFLVGAASGAVEPVFAVLGYFMCALLRAVQPWLLGFAAGAMLFAVVRQLLPESVKENAGCGVWGFVLGFTVMMILDVVLG